MRVRSPQVGHLGQRVRLSSQMLALPLLALLTLTLTLFTLLASPASAHDPPRLPRVLILGDAVYRQPVAALAKQWRGRAEVVLAPADAGEVLNSESALRNLPQWLGDGQWELIHFNVGLGDLLFRVPQLDSVRVLPQSAGGVRTPLEQYRRNLTELVTRLKASGAKLVWASTTPIRSSPTGVFEPGSEVQYNAVAARVMEAHQIPINDMHAHVSALIDMNRPAPHGADPFHFDKQPIDPPIAAAIREHLKLAPDPTSENTDARDRRR